MFEWLAQPEAWSILIILTLLEIILGVDNIIFIAIAITKLPPQNQKKARVIGLFLAMFTRIALLFSIAWIITLQTPIIKTSLMTLSGKDIFLIAGGIFLIYKGILELKNLSFDANETLSSLSNNKATSFFSCVLQIAILDIVFSLDSVITAVGMLQNTITNPQEITLLASIAIIIAVFIMIFVSGYISEFINKNPSIKLLALCFLILIGANLITDGLGYHISKNYIYTAVGFSLFVECIKIYKNKS